MKGESICPWNGVVDNLANFLMTKSQIRVFTYGLHKRKHLLQLLHDDHAKKQAAKQPVEEAKVPESPLKPRRFGQQVNKMSSISKTITETTLQSYVPVPIKTTLSCKLEKQITRWQQFLDHSRERMKK